MLTVEALQTAVSALGFELVDCEFTGPTLRRQVKLRIDRIGGSEPGHGVTSDDCRLVSRAIETMMADGTSAQLAALEVSSPGIERPVRFVEHWRRFIGRDVRLRATGVPGTAVARIIGVPDDTHVELQVGDTRKVWSLDAIRAATLVVDWSTLGITG